MITQAKKGNKSIKNSNKIIFQNKNINKLSILRNDLIISYYTLQFISPRYSNPL